MTVVQVQYVSVPCVTLHKNSVEILDPDRLHLPSFVYFAFYCPPSLHLFDHRPLWMKVVLMDRRVKALIASIRYRFFYRLLLYSGSPQKFD